MLWLGYSPNLLVLRLAATQTITFTICYIGTNCWSPLAIKDGSASPISMVENLCDQLELLFSYL
ncbi:unnamed protein product [Moneuplotes crassus]|uniref:Uncharacterized protein n=1 Tax=Euplotes crassus TaxID=5936 RepID=A0AAD2D6F0_EUPCR|nr:unnamed protein product [Moneuplotes crassus]